MDEKTKKIFIRIKLTLSILIILFLIYYLVFAIIGASYSYKSIINKYVISDTNLIKIARVNKVVDSLLARNTFLKAKSEVIENDSIYLCINLKDSLITLEIQGVKLHEIKMNRIKKSKLLKKLPIEVKYSYISEPFNVESYYSTIPKVPIVVKKAPKDTVEAQKMNSVPQIPPEDYVHCVLFTDKNLNIFLDQVERPEKNHLIKWLKSNLNERWFFIGDILRGCFSFKIPDYKLWIRIEIPSDDLKTIFRALPERGMILIYY